MSETAVNQPLITSSPLENEESKDEYRSTAELTEYAHRPPSYSNESKGSGSIQTELEEDDPWSVTDLVEKTVPWKDLSTGGKVKRVLWNYIFRQVALIALLYMFICSLDFLSSAFRLLGGKAAGQVFANSKILRNPVAGLMIGVLATVLVQSSSTSTSIVVSMVGARLLDVQIATPIIMGANIGTSVTNTIVSIGQSGDKNQYRRAFGGATIHDMFNWLSVLILLPLELATGYLTKLSLLVVESFHLTKYENGNIKLLKAITEPFTKYVIKVDTGIIAKIAKNETDPDTSLITTVCKSGSGNDTVYYPCEFMFMNVTGPGGWKDWVIGLILLFIALTILCTCLILIVKILNSLFKGHIAVVLKKFVNADFPGACGKYGTGYIAIVIGALLTILVQSSSIFTSALTPLCGLGVITIERMYPLTLGSNIGTTFTSVLAALAQDGEDLENSLQISMCHLFFNISGILLWYPIPFMRKAPILMAKKLGDTTAKYRWFAILYLILAFFVLPAFVFALSLPGWEYLLAFGAPLALLLIIIAIINVLQSKKPQWLPAKLRTWNFLPLCCHSFKPADRVITRMMMSCACCQKCIRQENDTIAAAETGQAGSSSKL